jgi:hypothetical protein
VTTDPWHPGDINEGPPPKREDPPARETQNPKEK